jgi:hypothetical protein
VRCEVSIKECLLLRKTAVLQDVLLVMYEELRRTKGRKENEDFNSDGMDLGCRMAFLFLARRELLINLVSALIGGLTGVGASRLPQPMRQPESWTDRQPTREPKFLIRKN